MIITIANHKGGVSKTTTALNLAECLSDRDRKDKKVLLVDLDSQKNLTMISGAEDSEYTSANLFVDQRPVEELIQPLEDFDIIVSTSFLSNAEEQIPNTQRKFYLLKEALDQVKDHYDYIILDCPPSIDSTIVLNALTASDQVIIPVQSELLSYQGLSSLGEVIRDTKNYSNPDLKITGILITRHNPRTLIEKAFKEELEVLAEEELETSLFENSIRESVIVKEAQAMNQPLSKYSPNSNPAKDYAAFTEEFLRRVQDE